MAEENKTIITRIQNRRGLKQDLPKPLRPGELGFATDTRQIYIGADTNVTTDSFNKIAKFENVIGAKTNTLDLINNSIIKFQVPHRRYDRNTFDGVTTTYTWFPTSNANVSSNVGDSVFKSGETEFVDLQGGSAFNSGGLTVVKNGKVMSADTRLTASATNISSGADYFFSSGTLANSTHSLTFRTPPTNADEIGISYYSNVDVWDAITASGDIGTGGDIQGINGFHSSYSIPTYRYLDKNYIRIAGSSGTGLIGLSPKHVQLSTDVKVTPVVVPGTDSLGEGSNPSFTYNESLGNLFVSRNITKSGVSNVSTSSTQITVDIGLSHLANFIGTYGGYVTDSDTNNWANGKVLEIDSVNSGTNQVILNLPSNSVTLSRSVSTFVQDGSNVQITMPNTQNIDVGDSLFFIDTDPGNIAGVNGDIGTVEAITPNILVSGLSGANVDANLSTVSFITRKNPSGTTVVGISTAHGFGNGNTFISSNTTILPGTTTVSNVTADTFEVTTSGTVTDNATFTARPQVSFSTARVTPVQAVDVSLVNNLSEAVTMFNTNSSLFDIKYVPGSTTKIYLQENESSSKNSTGFRIHNDAKKTPQSLKLEAGEYTKLNSTVKSKLEQWLQTVQTGSNLLSNVCVNTPYSNIGSFTQWALKIDNAKDEVKFISSEEARNLATILNRSYFDTENTDIKGLLNVKTNIEVLTVESQEAGDSDQQFSAPLGETINALTLTNLGELEVDTSEYDALFVEYSMVDTSANTSQTYKRIGTLQITGDVNSQMATINDQYSDIKNNVSGNINLSATVGGSGVITVTADNSLVATGGGGLAVEMKFIKRSWTS